MVCVVVQQIHMVYSSEFETLSSQFQYFFRSIVWSYIVTYHLSHWNHQMEGITQHIYSYFLHISPLIDKETQCIRSQLSLRYKAPVMPIRDRE